MGENLDSNWESTAYYLWTLSQPPGDRDGAAPSPESFRVIRAEMSREDIRRHGAVANGQNH
jgi:hypothetical protein